MEAKETESKETESKETEKRWNVVRRERMSEAVQAGKRLFLQEKIENVKMTQIAEAAGYGVASLYRYFATKEAIAIAVAMDLWKDIKTEYVPRFDTEEFLGRSGIERIRAILDTYSDLLRDHRDFLLFLADFDAFCLKTQISKEKLAEYEQSIRDFYIPYLGALEQGAKDQTVSIPENPELTYLTINHTMLALMQKIAAGDILDQDRSSAQELDLMREVILQYFQKK